MCNVHECIVKLMIVSTIYIVPIFYFHSGPPFVLARMKHINKNTKTKNIIWILNKGCMSLIKYE